MQAAQEEHEVSGVESEQPPPRRRRVTEGEDETLDNDLEDATQADSTLDQMVKNLVRLALASEYSRTPIRRADISAKGEESRRLQVVVHRLKCRQSLDHNHVNSRQSLPRHSNYWVTSLAWKWSNYR